MGFPRQEYWVVVSFFGGSSWSRDQTCVSCIPGIASTLWIVPLHHPGRPPPAVVLRWPKPLSLPSFFPLWIYFPQFLHVLSLFPSTDFIAKFSDWTEECCELAPLYGSLRGTSQCGSFTANSSVTPSWKVCAVRSDPGDRNHTRSQSEKCEYCGVSTKQEQTASRLLLGPLQPDDRKWASLTRPGLISGSLGREMPFHLIRALANPGSEWLPRPIALVRQ